MITGCAKQDSGSLPIDFEGENDKEITYEFGHGVIDYNFDEWNYDGLTSLDFDYVIDNQGSAAEFGLIILIDGIPQRFNVEGSETMMHKVEIQQESRSEIKIELTPEIEKTKNKVNLTPILILNPSIKVQDIKEYGVNHSISSAPTVNLSLETSQESKSKSNTDIIISYTELPDSVEEEYIKNGFNMLETEIYLQTEIGGNEDSQYIDSNDNMDISILGKSGEYRLLTFVNNEIVDYYNVVVNPENITNIKLGVKAKAGDNIYFFIVPRDVQEPQEFVLPSQSMKWIVK